MTAEGKKFYPDYLFLIIVTIISAIELVLCLALIYPQEIGREINFSAPFQPAPEWYFLWLYEIMRYFPGMTIFIGTAVIPASVFLLFLCIPFIDNGDRGYGKARAAIIVVFAIFIVFTIIAALRPS